MEKWKEKRYLVKIAYLYYVDNWTQAQIAEKMDVSRPLITKALQKAKKLGIIKVFIDDSTFHTVQLEDKIQDMFNLTDVVIVPENPSSKDLTLNAVAKAGANYLHKNLKNVQTVGVSWGKTLSMLVDEYPYQVNENVEIVPLEGGMGVKNIAIHANQLAYKLSNKMNGTCSYIYAPAIVESNDLYERLKKMDDIRNVLQKGEQVDIALIGLGNPFEASTLEELGYIQDEDKRDMSDNQVVGDLGFRFYDINGIPVKHVFEKQVIGISLEKLKKVKKVIAVASGRLKATSIYAALKGGFVDVLVTDQAAANEIISMRK